jgi:hypothetical protein
MHILGVFLKSQEKMRIDRFCRWMFTRGPGCQVVIYGCPNSSIKLHVKLQVRLVFYPA